MDSNYYRNGEDLHFKMISHEEERELFRKAKAGDVESREFLITNHMLWVLQYGVKKSKGRLPNDEVVSAMNEALMTAIDRFNPDYKNRFRRFLEPFLQGAMARLWSSKNPVKIPQGVRDPNFVGSSQQFVPFPHVLTDESPDEFQDESLSDSPAGPAELAEDSSRKEYLVEALNQIRSSFSARENQIIDMMYVEGLNMAKVGLRLNISRERVRQIHDVCLTKLRDNLPKSFPNELSGT